METFLLQFLISDSVSLDFLAAGSEGCSRSSLSWLRRLFSIHVRTCVLTLVAAVVVPTTLSTVIVVSQNKCVGGSVIALRILDISHAMELFADRPLDYHILFVLVILRISLEMKLIVVCIRHDNLGFLHMDTNRKDSLKREVGVFDIATINFFVLVEKVGVLELLNGFLSNLTDPVVHSESSIFENHLLKVVEFVTLIVVRLEVLDKLADMLLLVHDLGRVGKINCVDHHSGDRAFLDCQELKEVRLVDLSD